jgi:hypothetical protein
MGFNSGFKGLRCIQAVGQFTEVAVYAATRCANDTYGLLESPAATYAYIRVPSGALEVALFTIKS